MGVPAVGCAAETPIFTNPEMREMHMVLFGGCFFLTPRSFHDILNIQWRWHILANFVYAACWFSKALLVWEFLGTIGLSPTNHPETISKIKLTGSTDFRRVSDGV